MNIKLLVACAAIVVMQPVLARDYEPRYGVKEDPMYDPAFVEDWDPAYPRYVPDYDRNLNDRDYDRDDHKYDRRDRYHRQHKPNEKSRKEK